VEGRLLLVPVIEQDLGQQDAHGPAPGPAGGAAGPVETLALPWAEPPRGPSVPGRHEGEALRRRAGSGVGRWRGAVGTRGLGGGRRVSGAPAWARGLDLHEYKAVPEIGHEVHLCPLALDPPPADPRPGLAQGAGDERLARRAHLRPRESQAAPEAQRERRSKEASGVQASASRPPKGAPEPEPPRPAHAQQRRSRPRTPHEACPRAGLPRPWGPRAGGCRPAVELVREAGRDGVSGARGGAQSDAQGADHGENRRKPRRNDRGDQRSNERRGDSGPVGAVASLPWRRPPRPAGPRPRWRAPVRRRG
jgi:hypothetical protein